MMPFDTAFPDVAKNETRAIHVFDRDDLPRGAYLFREFYCNEANCDCRRVLLQVYWAEGKRVAATSNYAFEPSKPPFDDEPQIFLDPINPQSDSSELLFATFGELIASDRVYRDRLVRHYEMWKVSSMTRRIPTTQRSQRGARQCIVSSGVPATGAGPARGTEDGTERTVPVRQRQEVRAMLSAVTLTCKKLRHDPIRTGKSVRYCSRAAGFRAGTRCCCCRSLPEVVRSVATSPLRERQCRLVPRAQPQPSRRLLHIRIAPRSASPAPSTRRANSVARACANGPPSRT